MDRGNESFEQYAEPDQRKSLAACRIGGYRAMLVTSFSEQLPSDLPPGVRPSPICGHRVSGWYTPLGGQGGAANNAKNASSCKTGRGLGCGWHLGDFGVLERDDLPLVLFLYDDQCRAGFYFACFGAFLELHARSGEYHCDIGAQEADAA